MWLREVALEVCVTNHFFKVGTCLGVAEEILREEDDELVERKKEGQGFEPCSEFVSFAYRFTEVAVDLTAEDVELEERTVINAISSQIK